MAAELLQSGALEAAASGWRIRFFSDTSRLFTSLLTLKHHLHLMVLGSRAVRVCIHLPSQRRKTRIRGGGEGEEALSLSVRLFLTAAISLIRLWRNRNLAPPSS